MEANVYWENYQAACEWQKRHNCTWWIAQCHALEYENHLLRDTVKNLAYMHCNDKGVNNCRDTLLNEEDTLILEYEEQSTTDSFEFNLNEDMLNFLSQSIRHKRELEKEKECQQIAQKNEHSKESKIDHMLSWNHQMKEKSESLYGKASPKILAMEAAVGTTFDRNVSKSKLSYWPNIPLKL